MVVIRETGQLDMVLLSKRRNELELIKNMGRFKKIKNASGQCKWTLI